MFDHPLIQVYAFEDIPLDPDLDLMDEKWMAAFEAALVKSVDGRAESAYSVGYYSAAAARAIGAEFIELSWYPNTHDRFHQVRITLPRSAFITCVGSWQYDYKPVVFVQGDWLRDERRGKALQCVLDAAPLPGPRNHAQADAGRRAGRESQSRRRRSPSFVPLFCSSRCRPEIQTLDPPPLNLHDSHQPDRQAVVGIQQKPVDQIFGDHRLQDNIGAFSSRSMHERRPGADRGPG